MADVEENTPIHPTTLHPATAIDVLEQVLARDGAAVSATTQTRETLSPAARLTTAVARYNDALHLAAELTNPHQVVELDHGADEVLDGLTGCPAWPTLRAHLLLTATDTTSPLQLLRAVIDVRELATAADPAAVLTWRLPHPTSATTPPLPWLPAIPERLATDPDWGPYLAARATQVATFADELRTQVAAMATPSWALPGQPLTPQLIADVEVWRAAIGIDPADTRPTGPPQPGAAAHRHQQELKARLATATPLQPWIDLLSDIRADLAQDPYHVALAHRLAALHNSGVPVTAQLAAAVAEAPLPGQQPAAALWWRLTRHLTNTPVTGAIPAWEPDLARLLGTTTAIELEASPWWPQLAAEVTTALQHGHPIEQILVAVDDMSGFDDPCHALLWRTQQLQVEEPDTELPPHPDQLPPDGIELIEWDRRNQELARATLLRARTQPDFTDLELRQGFAAADRWADQPHTPQRLGALLEATTVFFQQQLPGNWSHPYLTDRLGTDLAGDQRFPIGHAPAGWTTLISHLRKQGFTLDEMLTAGIATRTRTGNIIDRFRDRAILPITNPDSLVIGFVGRRHPDATDKHGPKYLNSPTGPLFHKSSTLYGAQLLTPNAVPVIVEGPLDAIAVTLAGNGKYIGVAPLGTAITPEQVLLLRHHPRTLIATDADQAGHLAAEHAFWLLAGHHFDPQRVQLPAGSDPAQIFHDHGPTQLYNTLLHTAPQAHQMISDRLALLPPGQAARHIAEITAARPPHRWPETLKHIPAELTGHLIARINAWTTNTPAAGTSAREQTRRLQDRLRRGESLAADRQAVAPGNTPRPRIAVPFQSRGRSIPAGPARESRNVAPPTP